MDGQRFDALTRGLASGSSRRSVLKGLFAAAAAGAFGIGRGMSAGAQEAPPLEICGDQCTSARQCRRRNSCQNPEGECARLACVVDGTSTGSGICVLLATGEGEECEGGVCSGGTCAPGCVIGGQIYAPGPLDPSLPCTTCDPSVSTSSATILIGCCDGNNACPDSGPCTTCTDNVCVTDPNCCDDATDCTDFIAGGTCVVSCIDSICGYAGCCSGTDVSNCPDCAACQSVICGNEQCSCEVIDNCCTGTDTAGCDACPGACDTLTCENDVCTCTDDPTCCVVDGDCPVDDVCLPPSCVQGTCQTGYPVPGCCTNSDDCLPFIALDSDGSTIGACSAYECNLETNTCEWVPLNEGSACGENGVCIGGTCLGKCDRRGRRVRCGTICRTPRSFQSDPFNCGTCGLVCGSGLCVQGVCSNGDGSGGPPV